jgi:hypothetical protein
VSFHGTSHQQIYLTLKHLGQDARLHTKVYDTIHAKGKSLEMLMQQSNSIVQAYGVTGLPVFGVGGRFVTSPARVGGSNARALEVVEYLVGRA